MYSTKTSLFNIYGVKTNTAKKSFSFENSMIKNKKTKLLNYAYYEKLFHLDFEDIYKNLNDSGYSIGFSDSVSSNLNKIEEFFNKEMKYLVKSFNKKSSNKEKSFLFNDYLFIPYDFFNLKVIYKALYEEVPFENLKFSLLGTLSLESLSKIYNGKNISFVSPIIQKYLRKYKLYASSNGSFDIDLTWDIYLHEFYSSITPLLNSDFIKRVYVLEVDIKNIINLFRLKIAGKNLNDFHDIFIKNGSISYPHMAQIYKEDLDVISSYFSYTFYGEEIKKALSFYKENKDLSELEKLLTQYFLKLLKRSSTRLEGEELLLCYYYLKRNEISNLKILFTSKNNEISSEWALNKIRII